MYKAKSNLRIIIKAPDIVAKKITLNIGKSIDTASARMEEKSKSVFERISEL